jgi:uncharacterized membrane protein
MAPESRQPEPHPAADTSLDTLRTLVLGFAAGLRSIMPLAVLAAHLRREGPDIADGGWIIEVLASTAGAAVLGLAAIGEVITDKLPNVPARVDPLPLAGRVFLGGCAGAFSSLAEGRASDRGALIGSLGAAVGALTGYTLRTRLPGPPLAVALFEDVLGFALARWAITR